MRKIKLTPLQNKIMWILEEAGEESLDTIRATLRAQGDADEQTLSTALEGLERLGFVDQTISGVILTANGYAALTR